MTNLKQSIVGTSAFLLSLLPGTADASTDFQPPVSNAVAGLCALGSVTETYVEGNDVGQSFNRCNETLSRKAYLRAIAAATAATAHITNETTRGLSAETNLSSYTTDHRRLGQKIDISFNTNGHREIKVTTLMTDPETKLTDTGFAQVNEGDSFIILSSGGDKTLLAASEQTVAGIINGINEIDDCMATKVLNITNTLFDNNMFSLVMAADEVFKTGKTPSLWDRIKGKYVDIFGVRGKDNNEPDSFNVPTHEKYAPGGKVTPFSYKLGS